MRLEDPGADELREALERGADAVAVVSRDDAWPLRAALLVRHIDADVPIVATIFDPATGRELEQEIENIAITSLAEIVAPSLAGPCLRDDLAAVLDGDRPTGLRCDGGKVEPVPLPEVRARRLRALATAILRPFDRSAALVFFGAVGLVTILIAETVAAAIVLDQSLVDAFYGAVKTLVTVDPNPEVAGRPGVVQGRDLDQHARSAAVRRRVHRRARRAADRPQPHRAARAGAPCRAPTTSSSSGSARSACASACCCASCGISVVALDDQPDGENVGHARRMGLPVVIGRGADPSLLRRLSLDRAIALAAVTADDLQNIKVALAARAEAPDLRIVLRAGSNAIGGETRSLERLGHVRDVHRIGAVYIAGIALGSAAAHVVVDGDTAHLRDADGALEECAYPVSG